MLAVRGPCQQAKLQFQFGCSINVIIDKRMFQLFIQMLRLPPYNLNFDVIQEIIRYIPFNQAVAMGANDYQLAHIGKTSPPNEVNMVGKLEETWPTSFNSPITCESGRPWFITNVQTLEFMFQTRFIGVVSDMKRQLSFIINGIHLQAPAVAILTIIGRQDLIACVFQNAPFLLHMINPIFATHGGKNWDCLKFLLDNRPGKKVTYKLLHKAATRGKIAMVKYLLSLEKVSTCSPVIIAVAKIGNLSILKVLCKEFNCQELTRKEMKNYDQALCSAIETGHFKLVRYLFKKLESERRT